MTVYTTTSESEFGHTVMHDNLTTAVQFASDRTKRSAESEGYLYMIAETYKVVATKKGPLYAATASATFAKIVLATEPNEGDMEAEIEARGPEEKDYAGDLDMSDPGNWGKAGQF